MVEPAKGARTCIESKRSALGANKQHVPVGYQVRIPGQLYRFGGLASGTDADLA
jgi:hypothetical protein